MTLYRITLDGFVLGQYDALDWSAALDQYARDQGFVSWEAALCASVPGDPYRRIEISAEEPE